MERYLAPSHTTHPRHQGRVHEAFNFLSAHLGGPRTHRTLAGRSENGEVMMSFALNLLAVSLALGG